MRTYLPDYELKIPANLDGALNLMSGEPGVWQPFAGGTDLMVLLEAGTLADKKYISLWGLPELRGITVTDTHITLGAMTTYTQIQSDQILRTEFPMLCQAASWTGGVAIQNRGTLGGNIANASPAADSLPSLLVYEAELELISTQGSRWVSYLGFHTGYKTTIRRQDEIIKSIRLPRTTAGWFQYARKVGTRRAQAISKVCIAAMANVNDGVIKDIRIAYGSVAPVPLRCTRTESLLKNQKIDSTTIQAARSELMTELSPIDDLRSTSAYRAQVAGNLLEEVLSAED